MKTSYGPRACTVTSLVPIVVSFPRRIGADEMSDLARDLVEVKYP